MPGPLGTQVGAFFPEKYRERSRPEAPYAMCMKGSAAGIIRNDDAICLIKKTKKEKGRLVRYRKRDLLQIAGALLEVNDLMGTAPGSNSSDLQKTLAQCQESAIRMGTFLETMDGKYTHLVGILEDYCETIYQMSIHRSDKVSCRRLSKRVRRQLNQVIDGIRSEMAEDKKEVVFLPYKASMWDSLESVWRAAAADEGTDAYVVPIPYYDRNPDGSLRTEHYEGDRYPSCVPVTWYEDYDFKKRRPDAIFIHNPYDNFNYVTSVHPAFYARNLRQYTDMLVYIPYFVLREMEPDEQAEIDRMKHFCFLPGVIYAHRVMVQSEKMRQIYINEYRKAGREHGLPEELLDRGVLEKKILGPGSPKVDKARSACDGCGTIPDGWSGIINKPDGSRKKVILYNTGITALLKHNEMMIRKMENVIKFFREKQDEAALLWRPHPLLESTLTSMRPELWEMYRKLRDHYIAEGWGIYDETPDLNRAIAVSDAYYGDGSSVVQLCQAAGLPVMIQNVEILAACSGQRGNGQP